MATHAGLYGLKEKTAKDFKVDVVDDLGSMLFIRAEIILSEDDWEFLTRADTPNLLRPWVKNSITVEDWKSTVDLGLPYKGNVNVDELECSDPAVVLQRNNPESVRVYILKEQSKDGRKRLFYFYKRR